MKTNYRIQPIAPEHHRKIVQILEANWGSTLSVSRGQILKADRLPGFVALWQKEIVGLVTYHIEGHHCEITTLNSLEGGIGIGSDLIEAVKNQAEKMNCKRLWLVTTNDNVEAIRFYQKRGFHIAALYPGAIQQYRRLKPSIPSIGFHGIPIRDEIEFELLLETPPLS
jgi:ribosomal protein S18 acetylase RimI-like enzyme